MTHHRSSRRGFTLIELLVVLAIVATLLMLVAPRYFHKVDASKEAVLRDNLRSVRDMIDKFYGDNGRYPETLEELVEKKYLRGLPVDPITESTGTWQLVPVPEGYKGAVYDLRSGAQGADREGKKYAEW
ncbi:MAG: prepilin-type N-terminal cleavage/methylation domain-containing protein [Pseudomonadota bacterium]